MSRSGELTPQQRQLRTRYGEGLAAYRADALGRGESRASIRRWKFRPATARRWRCSPVSTNSRQMLRRIGMGRGRWSTSSGAAIDRTAVPATILLFRLIQIDRLKNPFIFVKLEISPGWVMAVNYFVDRRLRLGGRNRGIYLAVIVIGTAALIAFQFAESVASRRGGQPHRWPHRRG